MVRVSTALVKNWAVVTPSRWNGVSSRRTTAPTTGSELWNWLESTIRSPMVMRYASAVSDQLLAGRATTPRLRLTDVSCLSGGTPNVCVTRLSLLLVRMRLGTRAPLVSSTNWLLTLLNHTWPSEGARKPVLAAARRASAGTTWNRVATFPFTVPPKSL